MNPFEQQVPGVLKCPKCGEKEKIETKTLQYEHWRKCKTCGNEWSGGIGVTKPELGSVLPVPGLAVPAEEDIPSTQYTGANFRNPGFNYDYGDDE